MNINKHNKTHLKNNQLMVSAKSISLKYNSGPEILRNINLKIEEGSFSFLTGASGAGKTSLLSMLYLSSLPNSGSLRIFNYDVSSATRAELMKIRHKLGVIFQDFRLLNHLSIFDNIALPLRITKTPEEKIRSDVNDLLSWVGLDTFHETLPPMLSGGQKQLVAIARAIINKPKLILADEPTGSIDDKIASRLMQLFLELNKMGTSIIIATHNEQIIKKYDFPQLHLNNGNIFSK